MKKAIVAVSILLFVVMVGMLCFKQVEVNRYKDDLVLYEGYTTGLCLINEQLNEEVTNLKSEITLWSIDYGDTKLKEFGSVEELEQWLADDPTSENEYVETTYDCDDFSIDLSRAALADRYWLGLYIVSNHMLNFTIIDGGVYRIMPQTDRVDYWTRLD